MPKICAPRKPKAQGRAGGFSGFGRLAALLWGYFHNKRLTVALHSVIIVGFALKSEEFCLTEALQVVCGVDDRPKTDWLVAPRGFLPVQVGNTFK